MAALLGEASPLRCVDAGDAGRIVVAARDVAPGELLLVSKSYGVSLLGPRRRHWCLGCLGCDPAGRCRLTHRLDPACWKLLVSSYQLLESKVLSSNWSQICMPTCTPLRPGRGHAGGVPSVRRPLLLVQLRGRRGEARRLALGSRLRGPRRVQSGRRARGWPRGRHSRGTPHRHPRKARGRAPTAPGGLVGKAPQPPLIGPDKG